MKITTKIFAISLCLIMILVSLIACSAPDDTGRDDDTTEEIETSEVQKDTEAEPEPEPEPEPAYTWVIEPTDIKGDIQPVYNTMSNRIHPTDICFLNDNGYTSIIGSDGKIKCDLPKDDYADYNYCSVCECITNHIYRVTEPSYAVVEAAGGHGGGSQNPYIYDKNSGELYYAEPGSFTRAGYIERAIVKISVKYQLSAEERDWYDTDYGFKTEGGFGLYINGEIVQAGFDMYTPYSCGVIAMRSYNGTWGYYDTEGNEILPCEFSPSAIEGYDIDFNPTPIPYHATEGVLAICKDGKWGYADIEGNMLTDFEFDEARPVYQGKAWVKTSEGWGMISLAYDYTEDSDLITADASALYSYIV